MRYYGFANFMLSSIQQGVQNFHVGHDLFVKYCSPNAPDCARDVLFDWATNHKTAVFLNGGNAQGLRDVYDTIATLGNVLVLPYVKFHEDQESLDCNMTACGIVVPTHIVDMMPFVRGGDVDWSEYDEKYPGPIDTVALELAIYINSFPLAR